jgi:outer membrane protein assembly factor BamB
MISRRALCLLALLLIGGLPASAQEAFRFVVVSDARLAQSNEQPLRKLIAEVGATQPKPVFVVFAGNVAGTDNRNGLERAKTFAAELGMPAYFAPGVLDAAYSPTGRDSFVQTFKKIYQSWDYSGCHFVALDTTVISHSIGHLDAAQLKWVEADLKKVKKGSPIFIFSFHPIANSPNKIDDSNDLLRILAPHNVIAAFSGEPMDGGERRSEGKLNGIRFLQPPAGRAAHQVVEVSALEVRVLRSMADSKPGPFATMPRNGGQRRKVAFGWDDPNVPLLARRQFLAELHGDKGPLKDERIKGEFSIDEGEPTPMIPDERVIPGEGRHIGMRFMARFETKGMGIGHHALKVRLTASDGEAFEREEDFSVELLAGQTKQKWSFQAPEGFQAGVVIDGTTAYASSTDGRVYALDLKDGKKRWNSQNLGPVVCTPAVSSGILYVTSADHNLYALDSQNGTVKWKFDAGAPILASPAVFEGTVCIGVDNRIAGIDISTGKQRWSQVVTSYFVAAAAASNGAFYLAAADGTLYAIEAPSGSILWKSTAGQAHSGVSDERFAPVSAPTVGLGRVYFCGRDGALHILNAKTGEAERADQRSTGEAPGFASVLFSDSKLFATGLGSQGNVFALDARSGAIIWTCHTGYENSGAAPAMPSGKVVVTALRGAVSVIDSTSGKIDYRYTLPAGCSLGSVGVSGKLAVAASLNGVVTGISLP